MKKKKTKEEKAKLHDCDGICYWETGMCPRADYCEETRTGEFIATVLAVPIIILTVCFFIFLLWCLMK